MDHDRLFKELLTTFFVEFLELFSPDMVRHLDRDSLEFLDKEVFTDVTSGDRHEMDLVVKARYQGQPSCFLVHVEPQARAETGFGRRMFRYFARLHEKHALAVYPVALFSFEQPRRAEPDAYRVEFSDLAVLTFRFRVVQLNRLHWRNFVERTNPIAAALMAKMQMEPEERPRVKLACLSLLGRLQLDPARRELISGFVDSYLRLTIEEEQIFREELSRIEPPQREQVMDIVTSWMEKGLEQGREEGQREEGLSLVRRLLQKRFGPIDARTQDRVDSLRIKQLEALAEALLDFQTLADLAAWLDLHDEADGQGHRER